MNSKIVVVGSLNADLVMAVSRFPRPGETLAADRLEVFPGGKGANQAYGAGKLGGDVSMIGQVGNDAYATWLKGNLESVGVDVSHVGTDAEVATGTAVISVDSLGQNQIMIAAGANGTFGVERLEASSEAFIGAKVVMLQLEVPMATVRRAAALARLAGALVMLDPAPACVLPSELSSHVDYLTPNETELCLLTGGPSNTDELGLEEAEARCRRLLDAGVKNVLLKLGSRGALWVAPEGRRFWPALGVRATDSTAAGDAFNAGFAYSLAAGADVPEAVRTAMAAGAFSVTRAGAQPSMASLFELEPLLKTA